MHIRIRLLLMKEAEQRNQERIKEFKSRREGASKRRKMKASRRRYKPIKKP